MLQPYNIFTYLLFPELPLDMGVTDGSDYGDIGMKEERHGSDTVKDEMLPSGPQSGTEGRSHTGTQTLETRFLSFCRCLYVLSLCCKTCAVSFTVHIIYPRDVWNFHQLWL